MIVSTHHSALMPIRQRVGLGGGLSCSGGSPGGVYSDVTCTARSTNWTYSKPCARTCGEGVRGAVVSTGMLDVLKAVRAHRRQQLLDPHTVQRGLDRSACRVESDGGAGLDLPHGRAHLWGRGLGAVVSTCMPGVLTPNARAPAARRRARRHEAPCRASRRARRPGRGVGSALWARARAFGPRAPSRAARSRHQGECQRSLARSESGAGSQCVSAERWALRPQPPCLPQPRTSRAS